MSIAYWVILMAAAKTGAGIGGLTVSRQHQPRPFDFVDLEALESLESFCGSRLGRESTSSNRRSKGSTLLITSASIWWLARYREMGIAF